MPYHELINTPSILFDRVPDDSFLIVLISPLPTSGPAARSHLEVWRNARPVNCRALTSVPGRSPTAHAPEASVVEGMPEG
jgi:hypothetical protein